MSSWSAYCCVGRVWPVAVVVAFVVVAGTGSPAFASSSSDTRPAPRMLRAAASQDHAWFVLPSDRDPDRHQLLHHPRTADGPYYSPQPISLSREPEAMTAHGNRVWVIFPPRMDEGSPAQRGAWTVSAEFDRGLDFYRFSPRDRLSVVEALPATGYVAGFVATEHGPVVLLVPSDRALSDADENDADENSERGERFTQQAGERPLLLQLRSKRWHELDLPEDAVVTRAAQLAAVGSHRRELVLLTVDPADPANTIIHRRAAHDEARWEQSVVEHDLSNTISVGTVRGRLFAVTQGEPGGPARMRYLRFTRTLDLGDLPMMRGRWVVLGLADDLRMIEYSTRDGAKMHRIDSVTGAAGPAEEIRVQRLPVGRVWYTSLLLLAAIVAVVLVLLVRPSRQEKVELPKGVGVMPPFGRCLALVMDLFPGGVLSMLVLRVSPVEVLRLPIFTDSLELAMPFLLMLAVTFVHTTLTELARSTTLGKAMLGARVISTSGDPPDAKQVLLRNGVKLLILLVPVLAIFALLNPNMRGFNDLVARTVVVGDITAEADHGQENEGHDGEDK